MSLQQLLKKYSAPLTLTCIIVYGAYIGYNLYTNVYGPLFFENSAPSVSSKYTIPEKVITNVSEHITERRNFTADTDVHNNPFSQPSSQYE